MIFDVTKTSNYDYREQIEIKTLDELLDFISLNGQIVIFPPSPTFVDKRWIIKPPCIEIYDGWRE